MRIAALVLLAGLAVAQTAAAQTNGPPTFAQSDRLSITVEQETVTFQPVRIAGTLYLASNDPALTRLLQMLGASITFSSDGTVMDVATPAGHVAWDLTANEGVIQGEDVTLSNATLKQGDRTMVAVAALSRMIGVILTPIDATAGRYALLPALEDLRLVEEKGARSLVLSGSGRITWQSDVDPTGKLELTFPQTVCRLPQDRMLLGDVAVSVVSRGGLGVPSRIEMQFPPNWKGSIGSRLIMNQCVVHVAPDFPSHGYYPQNASIVEVGTQRDAATTTWHLNANSPYAWWWQYDGRDTLVVDVLHASPVLPLEAVHEEADGPLQRVEATAMETDPYAVAQFKFKLAPGMGFKFERSDPAQEIRSLRLIVGPQDLCPIASAQGVDGFASGGRGVVVLDPGHGGSDPGCHSPYSGLQEKDVTLDICLRLRQELEARGWTVIMTREDDRDLTYAGSPDHEELGARVAVANNRSNVDIFVSIHCNASVSPNLRGTTIHWYKDEDYTLARTIEDSLGESLGVPMKGTVHSRFFVLRHTTVPAVLIETAYLTHPEEGDLLGQESFRKLIAERVATALANYMARTARTSSTHRGTQ